MRGTLTLNQLSSSMYRATLAKGAQEKMDASEFVSFTAKGFFSIRRTDNEFSGTWSDMIIEQSLMRSLKVSGGITHGRGTLDSVLA